MFRSANAPLDAQAPVNERSIFYDALKLQLSNPKVIIFFSSILLIVLPARAAMVQGTYFSRHSF
jgi:threonine/homoserine/homoserine lactone efflux protein